MNRPEKEQWISALKSDLTQASGLVLTRQTGLDASATFALRCAVRAAGAFFKVIKNTLAYRSFQGTMFEPMTQHLVGPLGVIYGPSILDVAKVVVQFSEKNEHIAIVAGMMSDHVLDESAIQQLASLPDLDTLRGKLVAIMQAPARRVLGIVQAPASQLARVVGAYGASEH